MRIPSNHVHAVIGYFRSELAGLYEDSEIDTFVAWCFDEYLGFSRSDLLTRQHETMNQSDLLRFHFAVKALKRGRPIQYILGKSWFFGMELAVNENALIPRPETEELVEWILADYKTSSATLSILDIGTGSGCIAIALKKNLPQAHVYALDVSVGALALARENALTQQTDLHFIQCDMLAPEAAAQLPSCSVIVSNPPYVKQSERSTMLRNVLEHEPHLALFVPDDDALVFYRAIAKAGLQKLKPGGRLYFEINEALGIECCILLQQLGYRDVVLKKDMSGKDRMIRATKS